MAAKKMSKELAKLVAMMDEREWEYTWTDEYILDFVLGNDEIEIMVCDNAEIVSSRFGTYNNCTVQDIVDEVENW